MNTIKYVVYIALLIYYLIFIDDQQVWPGELIGWVWVVYLFYFYLVKYFDGMNNTARNISRIYLMKKYGNNYSSKDHTELWQFLIPNSVIFLTILWKVMAVVSFALILFFQGWATAIIAHILVYVISALWPINYQKHLRKMQREYLNGMTAGQKSRMMPYIHDISELKNVLDEAVDNKINPQIWWADLNLKLQHDVSK